MRRLESDRLVWSKHSSNQDHPAPKETMTARDTVSMYSSKPNMFPPRKFLCDTWPTHNRWQQYLTTYILHAGSIYRSVSMFWVPTPSGRISKKHRCFLHVFSKFTHCEFPSKVAAWSGPFACCRSLHLFVLDFCGFDHLVISFVSNVGEGYPLLWC